MIVAPELATTTLKAMAADLCDFIEQQHRGRAFVAGELFRFVDFGRAAGDDLFAVWVKFCRGRADDRAKTAYRLAARGNRGLTQLSKFDGLLHLFFIARKVLLPSVNQSRMVSHRCCQG
jgi:hypothetical protein